jgi:hypothetical protein
MPDKLSAFVKQLSSGNQPALEANFKKNPEATMTAAGISKDHQKLVLSGDSAKLSSVLRGAKGNAGAAGDSDIVIVVIL